MWLACHTQEEIAEAAGVPRDTVQGWVSGFVENSITQESTNWQDFKPPIYNVWKKQEKTNTTSHFGKPCCPWGRP